MEDFKTFAKSDFMKLESQFRAIPVDRVEQLANALLFSWEKKKQVFVFGNGGSAGNAVHLANDFLYGVGNKVLPGLKIHALPANTSVVTCLANDEGYESIFVEQLKVFAEPGDIALCFSGSGNSPNIVRALEWCAGNNIETFAILGYRGGKAKEIANCPIHINIDDMQISEDFQLIIGHLLMQWMCKKKT